MKRCILQTTNQLSLALRAYAREVGERVGLRTSSNSNSVFDACIENTITFICFDSECLPFGGLCKLKPTYQVKGQEVSGTSC